MTPNKPIEINNKHNNNSDIFINNFQFKTLYTSNKKEIII